MPPLTGNRNNDTVKSVSSSPFIIDIIEICLSERTNLMLSALSASMASVSAC